MSSRAVLVVLGYLAGALTVAWVVGRRLQREGVERAAQSMEDWGRWDS